jgi:polyhydroxyalkanoate synthase
MADKGEKRDKCVTFFTSLLDFSDPGDISVFVDEGQLESLERDMNDRGYLDGASMATSFNMIRANDLIWSFFVNNYLLGQDPLPFDLLYWNSDSTRMPARMHSTYLRKMYLENVFREPGGMSVGDVPLDLGEIEIPAYFVSASADHIAPWKTTFIGAQLLSGPVKFILGKAGHVAGVINPPHGKQYGYYAGPDIDGLTADQWFEQATVLEKSWWPDWARWVRRYAGKKVAARVPGDAQLDVIEDAPGSYAKQKV